MPLTPLLTFLGSLTALVLAVLGVTDPTLTAQVQSTIVAGAALVVVVLAYCHHATKQNTDALSVAAVQAANAAAQLAQTVQAGKHSTQAPAAPGGPAGVLGASMLQAAQALVDARAGVVATAPAIPAQPAGPTLPGPALFPVTAGSPGGADDYPTQEIAAYRDVPATAQIG